LRLARKPNGSIDDPAKAPAHVAAGRSIEKGDGSPQFGPVNREPWDSPPFTELLADPGVGRSWRPWCEREARPAPRHDFGGRFTPKGA
jgi:hypothetical protein